ncbi:CASP-like protein 5A1 [Hibiscus syriacus]|uniref:CASP-like protein n=1 Tax=Hibiscus syriacus TaxID=106335 RepID=A0A6A3B869_HIBSY|nr:CASP-like protein 5A1 [Hibiscus syriacus]
MNVSRPAVHPVEAPPLEEAAVHVPRVRMKDVQGMPGTKGLQSLWILSLAFVDIYALLVKRILRNYKAIRLFTICDGITSTLAFAAACASAGITVPIGNDLNRCAFNHCTRFETATAMAFISWFAMSTSFLMNFWSLASQ